MFRISIDWKAALAGAIVSVASVVTVSLAAAGSLDGDHLVANSAAAPTSQPRISPRSAAANPPLICADTVQALGIAIFVAATAALPVWLISTAHQPLSRARDHR
jgi:hypothetical protein